MGISVSAPEVQDRAVPCSHPSLLQGHRPQALQPGQELTCLTEAVLRPERAGQNHMLSFIRKTAEPLPLPTVFSASSNRPVHFHPKRQKSEELPVSFPLCSSHSPGVKERPGLLLWKGLPLSHTLLIPGVGGLGRWWWKGGSTREADLLWGLAWSPWPSPVLGIEGI